MLYKGIYCCEKMHDESQINCRHHPENTCPDRLISYVSISGTDLREIQAEIIKEDGNGNLGGVKIRFCPWCGVDLDTLAGEVIGFYLKDFGKQ